MSYGGIVTYQTTIAEKGAGVGPAIFLSVRRMGPAELHRAI